MTDTPTPDSTYGGWSYLAFYAAIALYLAALVVASIGVNAVAPRPVVGAYWLGALGGLVYLEQLLERWLF